MKAGAGVGPAGPGAGGAFSAPSFSVGNPSPHPLGATPGYPGAPGDATPRGGKRACRYGATCRDILKGNCKFEHAPGDIQAA